MKRLFQGMALAILGMLTLAVSAADIISLRVTDVQSADDIISSLPHSGLYNLTIRFFNDVPPAERTVILNQALADERAQQIRSLRLQYNRLVEPPVLTGLANLRYLFLDQNELQHPPIVASLENLEIIDLGSNELQEAPEVHGLERLEVLSLSGNRITQAPALTGLPRLSRLHLSDNPLLAAPILTGLIALEELDLRNNQLTQPPVLDGLINLQALQLGGNRFIQPVRVPANLPNLALELAQNHQGPVAYELDEGAVLTDLVDIATPSTDSKPFFLLQSSLNDLPIPKKNPLTRAEVIHTMNLAQSWRYWHEKGMSQAEFDERIREIEPIQLEQDAYTVSRTVAEDFMRERGCSDSRIASILRNFEGDIINVTELLDAMSS